MENVQRHQLKIFKSLEEEITSFVENQIIEYSETENTDVYSWITNFVINHNIFLLLSDRNITNIEDEIFTSDNIGPFILNAGALIQQRISVYTSIESNVCHTLYSSFVELLVANNTTDTVNMLRDELKESLLITVDKNKILKFLEANTWFFTLLCFLVYGKRCSFIKRNINTAAQ